MQIKNLGYILDIVSLQYAINYTKFVNISLIMIYNYYEKIIIRSFLKK